MPRPSLVASNGPSPVRGFIAAIEPYRSFQTLAIGKVDLQRAEYYRATAEREQRAEEPRVAPIETEPGPAAAAEATVLPCSERTAVPSASVTQS